MNRYLTNSKITPRQAIVLYHDDRKSDFYLESHPIKSHNGSYTLLAAQPMSEAVMRDLAKTYIKKAGIEMAFGDIIGEHIIYAANNPGQNVVIWYRPAMKRKLNFDSHLKIKGSHQPVFVPATLYVVLNSSLYLFGLMNSQRPTRPTKLYRAPFFNIYDDGRVCMGTALTGKMKARTYELEAERFERAFYMAEQNGGLSRNVCKSSLTSLWTNLISEKKTFPAKKELIQHPKYKNLGEFIDKILRKRKDYDDEIEEENAFEGDFDDLDEEAEVEIGIDTN